MKRFCPLRSIGDGAVRDCLDTCVLDDGNGCLVKQALKSYVDEHKPLKYKMPTDEVIADLVAEADYFTEQYNERKLNAPDKRPIPYNYEEGGDWFGYGLNDIAP